MHYSNLTATDGVVNVLRKVAVGEKLEKEGELKDCNYKSRCRIL
jgi:hypothetical protein